MSCPQPEALSHRLWRETQALAEQCLRHPFVSGLGDGTLASEKYARFIGQDAFFLDVFARGYAAGVVRAPDPDARRAFHRLQCGVFEELKLHGVAAGELGIDLAVVEPLEATRAYTDFLLANTFTGTLGGLLASMTPCMRLYHFLGVRLAKEGRSSDTYGSWIETYAGAEFGGLVAELEALLDRYGQGTDREGDRYRTAMRLEYGFFDEAWR